MSIVSSLAKKPLKWAATRVSSKAASALRANRAAQLMNTTKAPTPAIAKLEQAKGLYDRVANKLAATEGEVEAAKQSLSTLTPGTPELQKSLDVIRRGQEYIDVASARLGKTESLVRKAAKGAQYEGTIWQGMSGVPGSAWRGLGDGTAGVINDFHVAALRTKQGVNTVVNPFKPGELTFVKKVVDGKTVEVPQITRPLKLTKEQQAFIDNSTKLRGPMGRHPWGSTAIAIGATGGTVGTIVYQGRKESETDEKGDVVKAAKASMDNAWKNIVGAGDETRATFSDAAALKRHVRETLGYIDRAKLQYPEYEKNESHAKEVSDAAQRVTDYLGPLTETGLWKSAVQENRNNYVLEATDPDKFEQEFDQKYPSDVDKLLGGR